MIAARTFAFVERTLTTVVLVVSGAYLLIYLYRWEWNRAIISGVFFVAAEVALATSLILRRLRALELAAPAARPSPLPPLSRAADPAVLERLRSTPVDRPDPFRWLSPRTGHTSVFVPVLLGAGVVLSALAYVIERVAEATAVPLLDRRLATRLASLSPPPGGLSGRPLAPPPAAAPRRRLSAMSAVVLLTALTSIGVLGWLGIDVLLDAQTRPDPGPRPATTTISLEIVPRHPGGSSVAAAEALWVGCRSSLGRRSTVEGTVIGQPDQDELLLVLRPGIGRLATRRLTGCLTDLKLDLLRAEVLEVEHAPPVGTTSAATVEQSARPPGILSRVRRGQIVRAPSGRRDVSRGPIRDPLRTER